ncbi:3',5'-cyclic-AMP phosphodiesterase [Marinobacter bohaiensis]|uniref:3',5'-cyclic-AMP phosphodiesterase n=1 Tax=Marinobacter bohaiensis TaxID=2201898 RepID=UPI000DAB96D0|nr:3',5'-cyclic-AMP phosphodiesterase [Marinobacter bohaiensis]
MHTPFTPSLTERPAGAPLRVLQVTDPHLMDDPDGVLLGIKTSESLQAVLDLIDRAEDAPDLVLASGDISQDGSEGSYRQFQAIMARFACPVIWMAGNHDDAAVMAKVIAGTDAAQRRIMAGGWQIVCLDSSVPGHVHGEIAPQELAFLRDCLDDAPDTPTLVVFHHHPVDIGCPWMERIGLVNRAELRVAIAGHAQVRGLLWGHVHQEWDDQRDGMRLMATPSTCIQFEPGSTDFSLDDRAPGYRWLELYPDGGLVSHVRRTTDYQYNIERDSHGY